MRAKFTRLCVYVCVGGEGYIRHRTENVSLNICPSFVNMVKTHHLANYISNGKRVVANVSTELTLVGIRSNPDGNALANSAELKCT